MSVGSTSRAETALAARARKRASHACVRVDYQQHWVRLASAGGWDGSRALEFVEEYDAFADRWTPKVRMHARAA